MRTEIRGIVLAAGRGHRLGALTADRPKCLVPLAGRALLDWQVAALARAGVGSLAVVRGYRGGQVERPGLHAFENPDWGSSDMVASLLAARSWLRSARCVIAYGDVVFRPAIVERLLRSRAAIALPYDTAWRELWEARFERPEDDAETLRTSDGRLVEIGARVTDLDAVEGQFMGLLATTPDGWALVETALAGLEPRCVAGLQTTALLQRLVERGVEVAAIPCHGGWCEVDGGRDLELYERLVGTAGWMHDWRAGWAEPGDPRETAKALRHRAHTGGRLGEEDPSAIRPTAERKASP